VESLKSFEDLRTVNGTVYDTFHGAYVALDLLEDNREWIKCFNIAIIFAHRGSLQRLFAMALAYGGIFYPMKLREQFHDHFCDDITPHWLERLKCSATLADPQYDYGLYLIHQQLRTMNKCLTDFYLPRVIHPWVDDEQFPRAAHVMNINCNNESQQYKAMAVSMNANQQAVFQVITAAIERSPTTAHFFLEGAGGTGKIYLYQALCSY
jgi:hypothetical protein